MNKNVITSTVFILLLLGCSGKDKVVSRVGSEKITVSMFKERMKSQQFAGQKYLSTLSGKKNFLENIVREKLVMGAAKISGFNKKKEYKDHIKEFKENQKKQFEDYKERFLMELFVKDLHEKELNVTDGEIETYYKDHKAEFDGPFEFEVQHILLGDEESAKAALARIKKGENFTELVLELSIDPTASYNKGKIGPFKKGDLVPEFEDSVKKLRIGGISPIVETKFGYHIIKKTSQKKIPSMSLADAKMQISQLLVKEKFDGWLERTKSKIKIKTDYDLLSKVDTSVQDAQKSLDQNISMQVK